MGNDITTYDITSMWVVCTGLGATVVHLYKIFTMLRHIYFMGGGGQHVVA
jgi:hypothetical protein